ncbi:MAG TPA: heparan-alpha-glucosaminide N-acetyltransferase domain-containing protein [Pyrinomonadaceae bacterium]|nr:heparan-alpha-glucosaminide N-acetyltransferase domain-containing protein [Pyrinomonadaceae bacterium]HMP65176.1 heparan-alpha-glucosaminide N-acetyltransferase domain-containing protein [Pyrinomonadaceae bacterium]
MNSNQGRLISLDVFRGITIAAMVLVNNPGTWSAIYGPLKHAEWHGITPTDYIFPFFLFIVGVAIPIALDKRIEEGITRDVYKKILTRSAAIFASGLAISALPLFVINETAIPWPLKWLAALSIIAALYFLYLRKFRIAFALVAAWTLIVFGYYFAGWEVTAYNVGTMRIPGVLQRIAVCYLIVSLIYLHTGWKHQTAIGIALLLIYWLLMTKVPVPGCEITTIDDRACNLAAFLDRVILGYDHMWKAGKVFDPEGILSTLPAIATTISGVLTGKWLRRSDEGRVTSDEKSVATRRIGNAGVEAEERISSENNNGGTRDEVISESPVGADPSEGSGTQLSSLVARHSSLEKATGLFFFGTLLLAIGWAWSLVFPLNKSLWTSSYTVYTSGLALLTLGVCYFLIDIKGYKRWAKPFVIFGVNALALFVFSGITARLLGIIKVGGPEGKEISLQQWIFQNLFLTWAEPINASLAYAIAFILFWLFLMWLLYRRRIFIKL